MSYCKYRDARKLYKFHHVEMDCNDAFIYKDTTFERNSIINNSVVKPVTICLRTIRTALTDHLKEYEFKK